MVCILLNVNLIFLNVVVRWFTGTEVAPSNANGVVRFASSSFFDLGGYNRRNLFLIFLHALKLVVLLTEQVTRFARTSFVSGGGEA